MLLELQIPQCMCMISGTFKKKKFRWGGKKMSAGEVTVFASLEI